MHYPDLVGTPESRLIVLRGPSGSGKSTTAQLIRQHFGRGIALVAQDNLRRVVLREHDRPGAANIGLIDLTTRYALNHGFHVVLEGILYRDHYGEMLRRLSDAHRGITRFFYFDVSFEETLNRHAIRPQAAEFGEAEMRTWYRRHDYLDTIDEHRFPELTSQADALAVILSAVGFANGVDVASTDAVPASSSTMIGEEGDA